MDLPKTVHPSRLSPHYITGYVWPVLLSIGVAVTVYLASPYLGFLPFPRYYLYLIALTPFVKIVWVEENRKYHEYEFRSDRVLVREGVKGVETIEQEDVPYEEITEVSSRTPPYELLAKVGDLEIHMAGTDKAVEILGIKHPERYEELMMESGKSGENGFEGGIREEMRELERRYEEGEIGRTEYERRYYYLKGRLDAEDEKNGG
ncbi:MAG: PH domain-containing protein [Candidatus Nanohaloarchaea archaeon]